MIQPGQDQPRSHSSKQEERHVQEDGANQNCRVHAGDRLTEVACIQPEEDKAKYSGSRNPTQQGQSFHLALRYSWREHRVRRRLITQSIAGGSDQLRETGISPYDLPTLDKIPIVRKLMDASGEGLALDIGSGTGHTTYSVFGERPTACIDLHAPNLTYHAQRMGARGRPRPKSVVSLATALPFKSCSFRYILCSEVLEHLEDDETAVAEIARVITEDGTAVITVPYSGMGYTSFLERLGIKTVHDFPGPEFHVRPGYDEHTLGALMSRHGLELVQRDYYLRFFTRVIVDGVTLGHIAYQRFVRGRRSWTWADAAEAEGTLAFRVYTWIFPALRIISRADVLLGEARGFGLVAKIKKAGAAH